MNVVLCKAKMNKQSERALLQVATPEQESKASQSHPRSSIQPPQLPEGGDS